MAIANFFDKICLSAAQSLQNFDRTAFQAKLLEQCVAVVYDENAVATLEGRYCLELLVRMLARLYPQIKIIGPAGDNFGSELKDIAQKINPVISLEDDQSETHAVVVGESPYQISRIPVFFIGSVGWNARFSTLRPQACAQSSNPFGAGAAACFAAANVFRKVFEKDLKSAKADEAFCFSTYSYQLEPCEAGPELGAITFDRVALVGLGAIGNGALWALQKFKIKGDLYLVDEEAVALSNLQRYAMAFQGHVGRDKVEMARELFSPAGFAPQAFKGSWKEFAGSPAGRRIKTVALALDNVENRIYAQALLPQKIINAWTSPQSLGISRHLNFFKDPCVCCLYLPSGEQKSRSHLITEALGLAASFEPQVRTYLANQRPMDKTLIQLIVRNPGMSEDILFRYEGQLLEVFYSEAICGGMVMQVKGSGEAEHTAEVPLVHESVLAGLLLAAELVIDAGRLREGKLPPLSKFNLAAPLTPYVLEQEDKHPSGRCICQDETFQNAYKGKWVAE